MICAIPFFSGDRDQAVRLAHWIRDLGGVKNHDCLLIVDEGTDAEGVFEPLSEAFRAVTVTVSPSEGSQGTWGSGTTDATAANAMFRTAADYVFHKLKVPFFWMEPDAAPTRSTWLDEIEEGYKGCGKPFMGMLVNMPPHERHMSGIGCYPFDVANHSVAMMMPGATAWDYAGRRDTVDKGKAHFTDLIQHVYRINGNTPEWPTFPTLESLSQIQPRAAVFHRCKSPDLIERLRERAEAQKAAPKAWKPPSREQVLEARVKELEAIVAKFGELGAKVPAPVATLARANSKKPKRTPEQQAAINERMAKARAGRKKLTGVK
jgi:hypothetical protein